jgi:N-methylhydantoinase A
MSRGDRAPRGSSGEAGVRPERIIRLAVDVGGTFTDLVTEDASGCFNMYKTSTVAGDPVGGVLEALELAAADRGTTAKDLLEGASLFVHGTTRATNAIIGGYTARTALLATEGHPDILLWREGTRVNTFDHSQWYPEPYVSRALTFEVPERIDAQGVVIHPLDEGAVVAIIDRLRELKVEAVAVCLLWSILNGTHERRLGEILDAELPGVPYTLSHVLTPALREYRRASASCIDASLKPLMGEYLSGLAGRLKTAGLRGQLLMMTSSGAVRTVDDVAQTPIHSLLSGPAAAPVAGRYYAQVDADASTAIVTDAGGTSYDVSLIRRGVMPWTREAKLSGSPYGHITGFPSVDVRSIGAGGGSIAWVDDGRLLHVGPMSAGSSPGPACYGLGGQDATVTDACLVVGYLDPGYFLGGRMSLDESVAADAIDRCVAGPLGLTLEEAAAAVLELQIEHMVGAIESITLNQGVDPRSAVLVCGGGSSGFYSVAIARRLGCRRLVIPEPAATLSAMGALMSDLAADYFVTYPTSTRAFDFHGVNAALARLRDDCEAFAAQAAAMSAAKEIQFSAEARYPGQIWEIAVDLGTDHFEDAADVEALREDFHRTHAEIFAHADPDADVEVVTWRARVCCRLREPGFDRAPITADRHPGALRRVYFTQTGYVEAEIRRFEALLPGEALQGPAVIESALTTIVVDPEATAWRTKTGSIMIELGDPGSLDDYAPEALASATAH